MNCHECKYWQSVPGDNHIKCVHPLVENNTALSLLDLQSAPTEGETIIFSRTGVTARVDLHGFNKGWAYFPFLFDPIWVQSCSGFVTRGTNGTTTEVSGGGIGGSSVENQLSLP